MTILKSMTRRFFSLIFIFLYTLSFLDGQETEYTGVEALTAEIGAADDDIAEIENLPAIPKIFPLGPIIKAVSQRNVSWRPDWTLAIPPDAFRVLNGRPSSIVLIINEGEFRASWDRSGNLLEFPFLLDGSFVQVKLSFVPCGSGDIMAFSVIGAELNTKVEFIGEESRSSLARVTDQEGNVFFTALRYTRLSIEETLFDVEGNMLAHFSSGSKYINGIANMLALVSYTSESAGEEIEWYHYDSFGHISEVQTPHGVFSALYSSERRARHWRQNNIEGVQEDYTLQWDNVGFLNRIYGVNPPELFREYVYEYKLDARGNWIERHETLMLPVFGVLAPSSGLTVRRIITY